MGIVTKILNHNYHSFLGKDEYTGHVTEINENNIDYNFKMINKLKKFKSKHPSCKNILNNLMTRIDSLNDSAYFDDKVFAVNPAYVHWVLFHLSLAKSARILGTLVPSC